MKETEFEINFVVYEAAERSVTSPKEKQGQQIYTQSALHCMYQTLVYVRKVHRQAPTMKL